MPDMNYSTNGRVGLPAGRISLFDAGAENPENAKIIFPYLRTVNSKINEEDTDFHCIDPVRRTIDGSK